MYLSINMLQYMLNTSTSLVITPDVDCGGLKGMPNTWTDKQNPNLSNSACVIYYILNLQFIQKPENQRCWKDYYY